MTAADLIAEAGLQGLTFRSLAARLGCSTRAISHYFHSRTQLLQSVYDATNKDASMRLQQMFRKTEGRASLQVLAHLLPVSPAQQRIWRIWLGFWNSALFDPELGEIHRLGLEGMRQLILTHFRTVGRTDAQAEQAADMVMQAVFGIAVQAVFDPQYWHAERQIAAFERALRLADLH